MNQASETRKRSKSTLQQHPDKFELHIQSDGPPPTDDSSTDKGGSAASLSASAPWRIPDSTGPLAIPEFAANVEHSFGHGGRSHPSAGTPAGLLSSYCRGYVSRARFAQLLQAKRALDTDTTAFALFVESHGDAHSALVQGLRRTKPAVASTTFASRFPAAKALERHMLSFILRCYCHSYLRSYFW